MIDKLTPARIKKRRELVPYKCYEGRYDLENTNKPFMEFVLLEPVYYVSEYGDYKMHVLVITHMNKEEYPCGYVSEWHTDMAFYEIDDNVEAIKMARFLML
jgi:hypothetical protein